MANRHLKQCTTTSRSTVKSIDLPRHLYIALADCITGIVRHETGHVYEQLNLLTQEDKFYVMDLISGHHNGNWAREYDETFADMFRDWWASDGEVWPELTPILLRPQDDS